MFITITKKTIITILILVILLVSVLFALPSISTSTPNNVITIVIDAGHGGIDGGKVGSITGITEKELNLIYAKKLEKLCKQANMRVVMTRTGLNGLYDTFSENKKKDDMKKREEIIKKAKPDLVVSIHMNSFPLQSSVGAQCFFREGHVISENLANKIQECMIQNLPNARKFALKGDYYILNCSNYPSVIVECGYLSSAEEELLLIDDDYQDKVIHTIFQGIIKFFASI